MLLLIHSGPFVRSSIPKLGDRGTARHRGCCRRLRRGWSMKRAAMRARKMPASKNMPSPKLMEFPRLIVVVAIWTQVALAYAVHKSLIFFRVPLTAAVTAKDCQNSPLSGDGKLETKRQKQRKVRLVRLSTLGRLVSGSRLEGFIQRSVYYSRHLYP